MRSEEAGDRGGGFLIVRVRQPREQRGVARVLQAPQLLQRVVAQRFVQRGVAILDNTFCFFGEHKLLKD